MLIRIVFATFLGAACLTVQPGVAQDSQNLQEMLDGLPLSADQKAMMRSAMQGNVPFAPSTAPDQDVLRLQTLLNSAGFPSGPPDGIAGPGTRKAILAFQRSLGHPQTGVLTPPEMASLEAMATATAPQKVALPKSLPPVDVREIQTLLARLDFDIGTVDGIWGRRSQYALDQFRARNGGGRTGSPASDDLAALRESAAPVFSELPAFTDVKSQSMLASLPVVDRSQRFRIAWSAGNAAETGMVLIPAGTLLPATLGQEARVVNSPAEFVAPIDGGRYTIVLFDLADNTILLQRTLEVR